MQHIVVHCSVIVTSQSTQYIWIKIIWNVIRIECLHGTKFLEPDRYLYRDLGNTLRVKGLINRDRAISKGRCCMLYEAY